MTRETKVGLVIGLGIILLIGIIVSDHLSMVQDRDLPKLIHVAPRGESGINADSSTLGQDGHRPQSVTDLGRPSPATRRQTPVPTPSELDQPVKPELPTSHRQLTVMDIKTAEGDGPNDNQTPPPSTEVKPSYSLPPAKPDRPSRIVHYVKGDETLWGIAQHYYDNGEYWRSIAEANPKAVQQSGWIREGVRLVIPILADKVRVPAVPSARGTVDNDQGEHPSSSAIETSGRLPARIKVAYGDTLTRLATRYLGSARRWPQLLKANRDKLGRPEDLREGMLLRMPGTQMQLAKVKQRVQSPDRRGKGLTCRVQSGDSLSAIAGRLLGHSDRWSDIYSLNRDRLSHPDNLQVGQVLRIPESSRR